jgi:hypothetical protein
MPATELLKYISNKKVLFSAIIVFIIPFVLFAFWNFPSADDYMIINKRSQFSFWELQSDVYHNWSGRYFATFVSCAIFIQRLPVFTLLFTYTIAIVVYSTFMAVLSKTDKQVLVK